MRKGDRKLFNDPESLYTALMLRAAGWAFVPIAHIYNCDRTSLRDRCRQYVVLPKTKSLFHPNKIVSKIVVELRPSKVETEWTVIDGERICLGRNYADYIKR